MVGRQLGQFLRLPVPPAGIVSHAGAAPFFASLNFNLTGDSLPPVNISHCVRTLAGLSVGLLLFDIWIANCDRHSENFSVDFLATLPQMNVFVHSHALFGYVPGQGCARLAALQDRLGISWSTSARFESGRHRHCLLDAVGSDEHFGFWTNRIRSTPDFWLEEVCREAEPFGLTPEETSAVITFLKTTRDRIDSLILQHRAEYTAIQNWRPRL